MPFVLGNTSYAADTVIGDNRIIKTAWEEALVLTTVALLQ